MLKIWWQLVEWGFFLLYNQMAWSYDLVSWIVSLGQWRAWQRAALPFVCGPNVLELAHGPGHMLAELSQTGYAVTGTDLSPHMARMAQRRVRGLPVALARGRAQMLPFSAETFNTVLSTFPAPFIIEPETLEAIYRVLTPDGVLVIVPGARLTGGKVLDRFIEWLYAITGQRSAEAEPSLWQNVWQKQLRAAGFTLAIKTITLPRSSVTVIVARK
jgi:ubiquinone/menaquinone biosynthesis C-methylase UbiE